MISGDQISGVFRIARVRFQDAARQGAILVGERDAHLLSCPWGYALTCHRAQGSDFDRVIVVLDDIVDRSWLYTAITRGRRQIVLIGTPSKLNRIITTAPRVNHRRIGLDVFLSRAPGTDRVRHG